MIDTPFSIYVGRNYKTTNGRDFAPTTVLIIDMGADKIVQTGTDGSGQPKTDDKITSATFNLSEVFGAIDTNPDWIGNIADGD